MSNAVKIVVKMVVPFVVHHLLRKILYLPVDCSIVIFDFAGLVHKIYNGGQKSVATFPVILVKLATPPLLPQVKLNFEHHA